MLVTCPHCNKQFKFGLTPWEMKERNEKIIMDVLEENSQKGFNELLQQTMLSKKTLSSHLKRLEQDKKILRIVSSTFPPRVYYKLNSDRRVK